MSTTRIRAAIVSIAATTVVCVTLAGCSISRDEPSASKGSDSPPQTSSPSDAPTEPSTSPTPSATPGTASPSTTPVPPTPRAALLAPAELPQLNETSRWTGQRTGPARQEPFGLCQKFDMLSVGATTAVERTFTSGGDTAGQLVAEFPDAQNTVRAAKVLEAWHRDCAKRVDGTGVKVRAITDVSVPRGKGWWYLVSYEREGTGHFHSLGVVLSGNRLAMVRMDHEGQDHNYDPGMDPMELAVKAVSARLG